MKGRVKNPEPDKNNQVRDLNEQLWWRCCGAPWFVGVLRDHDDSKTRICPHQGVRGAAIPATAVLQISLTTCKIKNTHYPTKGGRSRTFHVVSFSRQTSNISPLPKTRVALVVSKNQTLPSSGTAAPSRYVADSFISRIGLCPSTSPHRVG